VSLAESLQVRRGQLAPSIGHHGVTIPVG
jgi:hypothetical protein